MQTISTYLRVRALEERWQVPAGKILALIRSGELPAVNLALRTGAGHRPRWRVSLDEVQAFERRRSAAPTTRSGRRHRGEKPADFVEYF